MKNTVFSKKHILILTQIIVQLALYIRQMSFITPTAMTVEMAGISIFFAMSNYVIFYICLVTGEKKVFLNARGSFLCLAFCYLLEPWLKLAIGHQMVLYFYVLFLLISIYLEIILEDQYRLTNFRLFALAYFFGILVLEKAYNYRSAYLYMASFIILCLMPGVFFLLKGRKIKRYGLYSYWAMGVVALIFLAYLGNFLFFDGKKGVLSAQYIFRAAIFLVVMLIYLLQKSISLKKCFQSGQISRGIFLGMVVLCIHIFFLSPLMETGNIILSALLMSSLIMMATSYARYSQLLDKELEDLLGTGEDVYLLEKYSQLFLDRNNRFLHDEILQDLIIIQKWLQRANDFEDREKTTELISKSIGKIRHEMNVNDIHLEPNISLCEQYYCLIKDIGEKYENDALLIDFNCAEEMDIPAPYNRVIYRALYELVSNIYKHSKGCYSEISLLETLEGVSLVIKNHGDYFQNHGEENHHRGIRLLTIEIKRLGGTFKIEEKRGEEPFIQCFLELPIKKEVIYEDFINRRS